MNQAILPTINIIGGGQLGKTLAKLILLNNAGSIAGVCNTSLASSRHAVTYITAGTPCNSLAELPSADITFITVPDDSIENTCIHLTKVHHLKPRSLVVHCSGALSADILQSAQEHGCIVASAHPLYSFTQPELSIPQFNGTLCALEGDADAISILDTLFNTLGCKPFIINKTGKAIYHAASVMACNYLLALSKIATEFLHQATIDDETALDITLQLMQNTLQNLAKTRSLHQALTGPIRRGDTNTIDQHLQVIDNDVHNKIYQLLGLVTLELTNHSALKKQEITNILSKPLIMGDSKL